MEELYSITFSKSSIICLGVTVILLILIPVAFWYMWYKSHKGQLKIGFLIAGVLGFIISARVLELGVHMFCIVYDNPVSRFINGHTQAYVLYGIIMAGVFEECGRYIILKYIMKKDRTRENAVLYGIGHAGIEVWAVLVPAIAIELAFAITYSSGNIQGAIETFKITEENVSAILPTILSASQFDPGMVAANTVERILTMFIHTGLTVVVFYGIYAGRKGFLPLAIALHMAADTFAALYQRSVVPLWLCEVWAAAWTIIIILIATKLYIKSSGTGITTDSAI